jgi:hypothetical protein
MDTIRPRYRHKLKGQIFFQGYGSVKEFAESIGFSQQQNSRIINGWIFPSPEWQRKAAQALGVTIAELRELL